MNFLNGWKTALGALGMLVGILAPKFTPVVAVLGQTIPTLILNISAVLAAVGLMHKAVKAVTGQPQTPGGGQ